MKQVNREELVGIITKNLTEYWDKLCDKHLKEGEARPSFSVIPTTQYIKWATTNFANNCKSVSGEDEGEMFADEALALACGQIDDSASKGYPILDDIIITCGDDNYVAEYNKAYTILTENLTTMVTGIIRHPDIVQIYLAIWQKICFGRYLYEIRNIITDDVVTGADMLGKLNNFTLRTQEESAKISSDPLSRFEVVTYDREAIKYVGTSVDNIRLTFDTYNKVIEMSQDFWVADDL